MKKVAKRRRRQAKTDYKARIGLLKSGKARVVFRKTNKYVIGQYVKSKEARDYVVCVVVSKELLKYGWPEDIVGSLKSLAASYLTGFLLGKKIQDTDENAESIFDIGLNRNIIKSRVYAFLKGVVDAGIKVRVKEDMFPDEARIQGANLKKKINFTEIKQEIDKRFV